MMQSYVLWHPSSSSPLLQLYQRARLPPTPTPSPHHHPPHCPNAEGCCVHRCPLFSAGAEMHHLKSPAKVWMSAYGQSVEQSKVSFLYCLNTCNCKMHDCAAQGQSRLCSGTSDALVADKVKCSPIRVLSCKMPAAGLMFVCPCKNHCLQTCWQFLEVEVEGHTHNATTSFGPQETSFLLTGVGGGGYTGGGPAACFGSASSRRAGVFSPDRGESWRAERRLLRPACCERRVPLRAEALTACLMLNLTCGTPARVLHFTCPHTSYL